MELQKICSFLFPCFVYACLDDEVRLSEVRVHLVPRRYAVLLGLMKNRATCARGAAIVGFVGDERVEGLDGRESSGGLNQFRVLRRLHSNYKAAFRPSFAV